MRGTIAAVVVTFGLAGSALAQSSAPPVNTGTKEGTVPAAIGNRANGRSYQPSQGMVGLREHAAGIAPSEQQQRATNDELFKLDKKSLQKEGQSTTSVPATPKTQ
jgi:hypothetical protein